MIPIKKSKKKKKNPTPLWLTLVWAGGRGGAGVVTIMFKREKNGIRGLKRMLWPPEP